MECWSGPIICHYLSFYIRYAFPGMIGGGAWSVPYRPQAIVAFNSFLRAGFRRRKPFIVSGTQRMLLNEGDALGRTYTVERFLGAGAFAEVYRVKHRILGRQALKVFKLLGTMEETELALKEPIMLSKIRHRNVIQVFDADIIETAEGTRGFFTMEYVAGGSLQDFWRGYGESVRSD